MFYLHLLQTLVLSINYTLSIPVYWARESMQRDEDVDMYKWIV
jgi:hypothetical protein